jgi:tRNA-Thr(GGU) m(6)t(6)A37 methyltransferase TsaA
MFTQEKNCDKIFAVRNDDTMKIIARIKTDFKTKFGVPRQSGLIKSAVGEIVFERAYRNAEAIRGLEKFSHIWVLWEFSKAKKDEWSPTVRPPILGGNKRMGVFATRSPYRPNPIGMSVLKIEEIRMTSDRGAIIVVSGCDMIDDTPVFDIKPYLPYCDSIIDAKGGFTDELKKRELSVEIDGELLKKIPQDKQALFLDVLKGDPRPSYHNDFEREYGFCFLDKEIKFKVTENCLEVTCIKNKD